MSKRIIITVKLDVTEDIPDDFHEMSNQSIKEFFADTPEFIQECDFVTDEKGNIVWDVERK